MCNWLVKVRAGRRSNLKEPPLFLEKRGYSISLNVTAVARWSQKCIHSPCRIWFCQCGFYLSNFCVLLIFIFCNGSSKYHYSHVLNVSNPTAWVNSKAFVFLSQLLSPPKFTALYQGWKPCILWARVCGIDLAVPGSKLICHQTPRLNCLSLQYIQPLDPQTHGLSLAWL